MKKWISLAAACLLATAASAQIEVGVRAGGVVTHGNTDLPGYSQSQSGVNAVVPVVNNKNNGMAPGYIFGAYGRYSLPNGLYFQGEINYAQFTLKQKSNPVDVAYDMDFADPASGNLLEATGIMNIGNITSESTVSGLDFSAMVGNRFMDDKLRIYVGVNVLFVNTAKQTSSYNNVTATANSLLVSGVPADDLIAQGLFSAQEAEGIKGLMTGGLVGNFSGPRPELDLTATTVLPDRHVKSVIASIELGAGYDLPLGSRSLGIDLRYTVPAFTGVYVDKNIKGFLGIASFSVSYPIFSTSKADAPVE